MSEQVNHPKHYNQEGRKECIEEMIDLFGEDDVELWCRITAYKYLYRMGNKENNTLEQDKSKAAWYIDKARELRGMIDDKEKNSVG